MAGAAVGFRVKSGWAAAVVLSGPVSSPLALHAHAMEGRLFRTVLEDVVRARGLSCFVLGEKTAFTAAVKVIHRRKDAIRRTLGKLGRHVDGPWRTEEKMAALAAWVAVAET